MIKKIKFNIKGISLLEAFLASFIFVISVSAIFISLIPLRQPVVANDQEVRAAMFAKNFLESLRPSVGNPNGVLGATSNSGNITQDGVTYSYQVVCVDAADTEVDCAANPGSTRKVTTTVYFDDGT